MPTIQAIIDTILTEIPGAPFSDTVDTIKTSDPKQPCTGIVTTFLATQAVIEQAIMLQANLVITHEPTFYNHRDETDWLAGDPVYEAKRRLAEQNGIVIWRFHDYWHSHEPDGIMVGVLDQLGWATYARPGEPVVRIPPSTLGELVHFLKAKLGVPCVRVIGNPALPCSRVGLMVGAAGGRWQISLAREHHPDVLICGEIAEWETSEYVRDAIHQGRSMGLIVVGHANSEEAGMRYLADWLQQRVPAVPITFVPAGDPFTYL